MRRGECEKVRGRAHAPRERPLPGREKERGSLSLAVTELQIDAIDIVTERARAAPWGVQGCFCLAGYILYSGYT